MAKTAFVTGASNVTGKGIALELAQAGYDVGVTYTGNAEGGADTVRKIQAMGRKCKAYYMDIRHVSESQETFAGFCNDFGPVDVMVNNAGGTRFFDFLNTSLDEYDFYFNMNVRGTYFMGQAAARNMVDNKTKGVIINISSVHAAATWPGDTIYATTKAAVSRLTQAQALDLAKHGVRVVAIAPGYIDMTGGENIKKRGITDEQYATRKEMYAMRIPLGRMVTAAEIGKAVVFMATEAASYITGQTLYMEGGVMLPVVTENEYM